MKVTSLYRMHSKALFLLMIFALAATPILADPSTQYGAHPQVTTSEVALVEVEIARGDTLDAILAHAGILSSVRAEAALAIAGVYDLTGLRPGNVVRWQARKDDPTKLSRLSLLVGNGMEIELNFARTPQAVLLELEIITEERRETLVLNGTLYDALIARNAPKRFAVDLAALMTGQVDFRRDIRGGEAFALVWEEDRLPNGDIAGEPRLSYARLVLGTRVLELVGTKAAGPIILFEDGIAVQRMAPPILGARLSSMFGRRSHPVLGGVRMHTGIDYAAPVGTEVSATGAGRVIFAGTMRGYGLTLDIDHGGGVVTRYAHLSNIESGVSKGTRIRAGDKIGAVGATGLVSGPNLHYEVLVDGRPVDPMEGEALPAQEVASAADLAALAAGRGATGYSLAEIPVAK